jgi:hypothetical protein
MQAHYLQSLKFKFLLKFCVKILFYKHYFSPFNAFMRKGKDPDPSFDEWIRIREAQKHAGPDLVPDPQHCNCKKL